MSSNINGHRSCACCQTIPRSSTKKVDTAVYEVPVLAALRQPHVLQKLLRTTISLPRLSHDERIATDRVVGEFWINWYDHHVGCAMHLRGLTHMNAATARAGRMLLPRFRCSTTPLSPHVSLSTRCMGTRPESKRFPLWNLSPRHSTALLAPFDLCSRLLRPHNRRMAPNRMLSATMMVVCTGCVKTTVPCFSAH